MGMEKRVKTDDTDWQLADDEALLASAVEAAGELALSFFGRGLTGTRKADNTPVSEADLAVDRLLHERLATPRPAYGWLSEESADRPARLQARRVWIIDPIDGTRAFLAGLPDWTISAALVEDGSPVLAAIFNPNLAEFFAARRGHGSALNGAPIAVSMRDRIEGSRMIANKGLLERKVWTEPWPPTESVWANSIAYRLALIAAGRADAALSITGKAEWDLAAAELLVQEAGGKVTDAKGAALRFNQPRPRINGLVAAAPALHQLLIARTRPVAADEI
jgi:myo-inositol-1(or 4)-monophosphatase